MKSTTLVTAIALAAAVFSVAANAQTGTPSPQQLGAAAPAAAGVVADADVGSYARYLMLNGKSRDEAIREARNIDHPAARQFAWHRARVAAPTQQQ